MTDSKDRDLPETYRGTVYPWQCDHVGHMNVMWYVGKFDEATWHLFAGAGITPDYLRESGNGMAAVEQKLTYSRELFAGDIVLVRSEVVEVGEKSVTFANEMVNAATGESAARCELTAVHMNRAARRASPFPAEIRKQLEALQK
jgi:acyl-CoA thioester hydrolase